MSEPDSTEPDSTEPDSTEPDMTEPVLVAGATAALESEEGKALHSVRMSRHEGAELLRELAAQLEVDNCGQGNVDWQVGGDSGTDREMVVVSAVFRIGPPGQPGARMVIGTRPADLLPPAPQLGRGAAHGPAAGLVPPKDPPPA